MVIIRTANRIATDYGNLEIRYILELPRFDGVFISTRDRDTGKTKLFLVFNERGRIYVRHGLSGTWNELRDESECEQIRDGLQDALVRHTAPCFNAHRGV